MGLALIHALNRSVRSGPPGLLTKKQPTPAGPIALHDLRKTDRAEGVEAGVDHISKACLVRISFLVTVELVGDQAGPHTSHVHAPPLTARFRLGLDLENDARQFAKQRHECPSLL